MAFEKPIIHHSKHVPWGGSIFVGEDVSTSTFKMSFAAAPGGAVLVNLNPAAAGVQGVSVAYDADFIDPESGEVVGASTITPQMAETSLEGLTWGDDPAADLVLHYDLTETPATGQQRIVCYGTFTIGAGVGD
jgi:hypothetical protein